MRARNVAGLVVALAIGGAAGAWAGDVLLRSPDNVLESEGYTLVEARQGTVEQSFRLNTAAEWSTRPVASNQASGTVTSIPLADGDQVEPGDVLYRVDLRPVVVAVGEVPAFRELAADDQGDDVVQLQRLLSELGHYDGEADGRFGNATYWAVREWQDDLGVEVTGSVQLGDVVFVPELPARLTLASEVSVGATLSGGESVVRMLDSVPSFTISLPQGQAQSVRPGQQVDIEHGGGEPWQAKIASVDSEAESEARVATLEAMGDSPICADKCGSIPLGEPTLLSSLIHVVPETAGTTVPAAALVTNASETVGVTLADGEFREVTIVESGSGLAVVEGVDAGERVRVPGEAGRGPVPSEPSPDGSPDGPAGQSP